MRNVYGYLPNFHLERVWEGPMEADEYKRHLLNHLSYSHAYLSGAGVELAEVNAVALCEAAMHAAACAWCIADYHSEAIPPEPIPAQAWEGIANRWIKAVEKWSKQLKANQAAAYRAPIRERAALKEFPPPNGRASTATSSPSAQAHGSTPAATATTTRRSGGRSNGPITGSGKAEPSDAAARAGSPAPKTAPKRRSKLAAPADV